MGVSRALRRGRHEYPGYWWRGVKSDINVQSMGVDVLKSTQGTGEEGDRMHNCIPGDRKIGFIHHPQSQNIVWKVVNYWNPVLSHQRPAGRCWNLAGIALCVMKTIRSPPHILTCLICEESYIYSVLRNNSSVHSVAITRSCNTLVLTASSQLSTATSYPFWTLPWERVSWPFFRPPKMLKWES